MNHYLFFNHISICDSDGGVPWDMAHPFFLPIVPLLRSSYLRYTLKVGSIV